MLPCWRAGRGAAAGAVPHDARGVRGAGGADAGRGGGGGDGQSLTFEQLNTAANQLARHLVELGAGPERIVAFALPPTPDIMAVLLAIQKAGAAYLPLDPAWPQERIAGMLADASPVALVTTTTPTTTTPVFPSVPCVFLDAPDTRQLLANTPTANLTDADRPSPSSPSTPPTSSTPPAPPAAPKRW
ncbi:AMP-binding protein [Streptomyces sp. MS1.AVA.1]|uniref:AMP-binding protein n=1 Tax=Streptomyces machairae TaxID=3134109 RepID=A0ABU8UGW7_9ACTN